MKYDCSTAFDNCIKLWYYFSFRFVSSSGWAWVQEKSILFDLKRKIVLSFLSYSGKCTNKHQPTNHSFFIWRITSHDKKGLFKRKTWTVQLHHMYKMCNVPIFIRLIVLMNKTKQIELVLPVEPDKNWWREILETWLF